MFRNTIHVITSLNGDITNILLSDYKDLVVLKRSNIVEIFNPTTKLDFAKCFADYKDNNHLGLSNVVLENESIALLLFSAGKEKDTFEFLIVSLPNEIEEVVSTKIELIQKQAELITKIVEKNPNTDEVLKEIMEINNDLINTKRELSKKNRILKQMNDDLAILNYIDDLTKINNRRKFFVDIYQKVLIEDYQLIMMDLNNFKIINDLFGHAKGDEVLQTLASEISKHLKNNTAELYRLGGDEFAILSPISIDLDIGKIITDLEIIFHSIHNRLGISYGISFVTKNNCNETHHAEERMKLADNQMYLMKNRARKFDRK